MRAKQERARSLVVAEHPLAAQAGLDVLRHGGNAIDAAVTAAFVMGVVEPWGSGLGGGGLAIIYRARDRRQVVVDFAMDAPLSAHPTMFPLGQGEGPSRFGWRKVEDDANQQGYRAAAVPGQVAGLTAMLQGFGTIPLEVAVTPAMKLAQDGCDVSSQTALRSLNALDMIRCFPATSSVFLANGLPLKPGDGFTKPDKLLQPDLARTLKRIATDGADGFYGGAVATAINAEMEAQGGLICEDDLRRYTASIHEDLQITTYRDYVVSGVPGACGCITVQQSLNILEPQDIASSRLDESAVVHIQAEAYRMAFADRYAFVADPVRSKVPMKGLLSKEYAKSLSEMIEPQRAMNSVMHGQPWEFDGGKGGSTAIPGVGSPAPGERSTTHLCAADEEGNVVTLTQTLANSFGCGVTIPGTGVVLNNAMLWFDPEPGRPNSVGPGKRGLNNMAPLLILKDDRPVLALGGAGGVRILNCVAQVALNILDHDMELQDAIDAPRIDCSGPGVLIDSRHSTSVIGDLTSWGHQLSVVGDSPIVSHFARPFAISITEDGYARGGGDRAGWWAAYGY
jgi:gamma-glutamyltranspeptidase/glutathione hydrolase